MVFLAAGASGCDKTTLLRKISGLFPTSIDLTRFSGADVARPPRHRCAIGMVFPEYAVFPDSAVAQIVG